MTNTVRFIGIIEREKYISMAANVADNKRFDPSLCSHLFLSLLYSQSNLESVPHSLPLSPKILN